MGIFRRTHRMTAPLPPTVFAVFHSPRTSRQRIGLRVLGTDTLDDFTFQLYRCFPSHISQGLRPHSDGRARLHRLHYLIRFTSKVLGTILAPPRPPSHSLTTHTIPQILCVVGIVCGTPSLGRYHKVEVLKKYM